VPFHGFVASGSAARAGRGPARLVPATGARRGRPFRGYSPTEGRRANFSRIHPRDGARAAGSRGRGRRASRPCSARPPGACCTVGRPTGWCPRACDQRTVPSGQRRLRRLPVTRQWCPSPAATPARRGCPVRAPPRTAHPRWRRRRIDRGDHRRGGTLSAAGARARRRHLVPTRCRHGAMAGVPIRGRLVFF
jgi:hypothetical protein